MVSDRGISRKERVYRGESGEGRAARFRREEVGKVHGTTALAGLGTHTSTAEKSFEGFIAFIQFQFESTDGYLSMEYFYLAENTSWHGVAAFTIIPSQSLTKCGL